MEAIPEDKLHGGAALIHTEIRRLLQERGFRAARIVVRPSSGDLIFEITHDGVVKDAVFFEDDIERCSAELDSYTVDKVRELVTCLELKKHGI